MKDYLLVLAGEGEALARRFPARAYRAKNLAQQISLHRGFSSAGGYRSELRALSNRLPHEMNELQSALRRLAGEANAAVNDPGRWGDAAAPVPVNDLVGFVSGLLDAIGRWLRQRKPAAG